MRFASSFLFIIVTCLPAMNSSAIQSLKINCKRTDANLNQCLKESIVDTLDFLKEIGIKPMNRLRIPRVSLSGGGVFYEVQFEDVQSSGSSDTEITDISFDLDTLKIELSAFVSMMNFTSKYKLNGTMLNIPFQDEGNGSMTLVDITEKITTHTEVTIQDGQKYLRVLKVEASIDIGGARFHLNSLPNGDKYLGTLMDKLLDHDWRSIIPVAKPALEDALSKESNAAFSQLFSLFSFDELLPED